MSKTRKLDNSTIRQKVALRRHALTDLAALGMSTPVIMETHGGEGAIWKQLYEPFPQGIVFEKDPRKASVLGMQRPHWRVYECDCVEALQAGVGGDLPINLLDCDPYGSPLDPLSAFFTSRRDFAPVLAVTVNDGLMQKIRLGGAWTVKRLQPMVEKYGNDLLTIYETVCREVLAEYAGHAGYSLSRFLWYATGNMKQIAHYYALFKRR